MCAVHMITLVENRITDNDDDDDDDDSNNNIRARELEEEKSQSAGQPASQSAEWKFSLAAKIRFEDIEKKEANTLKEHAMCSVLHCCVCTSRNRTPNYFYVYIVVCLAFVNEIVYFFCF